MSGRRQGLLASAIPLLLCSLLFLVRAAPDRRRRAARVRSATRPSSRGAPCTRPPRAATPVTRRRRRRIPRRERRPSSSPTPSRRCARAVTMRSAARPTLHAPFADGSCTTCHSPHASNTAHLLLKPQKELCADCHSEPGAAKFPHGPVEAGDCTACHAAARLRQQGAPRPHRRRALRRLPFRRQRPRGGEEGQACGARRRLHLLSPGARRRASEAPRRGRAGALLPVP